MCAFCGFKHVVNLYILKWKENYDFIKGDVEWNQNSLKHMAFFGLLAGFASGYVGLGGGVILNPIFISYEIYP